MIALRPNLLIGEIVPLLFAALIGCGIGLAYLLVQRRHPAGVRIANACIVLTIVICLISRVVADLATAFIVVGALTLVRLRAAIQDMREFGFLLLAVAAGLGAGEGRYAIVLIGALLVCALALFLKTTVETGLEHRVSATLPNTMVDEVRELIASTSPTHSLRLREVGQGRTGIRADFVGGRTLADGLIAWLRGRPEVQDLRYEAEPWREAP